MRSTTIAPQNKALSADADEPLDDHARQVAQEINTYAALKVVFGAFAASQNKNNKGEGKKYRDLLMGSDQEWEKKQEARRAAEQAQNEQKERLWERVDAKKQAAATGDENETAHVDTASDSTAGDGQEEGNDAAGFFRLLEMFQDAASELNKGEEASSNEAPVVDIDAEAGDATSTGEAADGEARAKVATPSVVVEGAPPSPPKEFHIEHDEL